MRRCCRNLFLFAVFGLQNRAEGWIGGGGGGGRGGRGALCLRAGERSRAGERRLLLSRKSSGGEDDHEHMDDPPSPSREDNADARWKDTEMRDWREWFVRFWNKPWIGSDGEKKGFLTRLVDKDPELAQALFIGGYVAILLYVSESLVVQYKQDVWNPTHGKLF